MSLVELDYKKYSIWFIVAVIFIGLAFYIYSSYISPKINFCQGTRKNQTYFLSNIFEISKFFILRNCKGGTLWDFDLRKVI